MTTPAQMQTQFDNDKTSLDAAASDYVTANAATKQAEDNYKNIILKKLDACKTADQILFYLQEYVFQNSLPPSDPHADDCLFGIFGDQVGLYGKGLQVNTYLTAVHNDLQKMIDSNSTDATVVDNVGLDLDKILDDLKGNPLITAMDPTALANMTQADTALRQQFYIEGDTDYNPTDNPDPTTNGYTYHFVYGNSEPYLTSFGQMEANMKVPGDALEATEGYKALTDNLNSDSGMSQTVNSELNEKINQLTNFIKTLLGFYENGLLQPGMKLTNVAIQNQMKGS